MSNQQIVAAQRIGMTLLEAIKESSPLGAPSGILYAGLMTAGCTKNQYDSFIDTLTSNAFIEQTEDFCLHITTKGKEFLVKLQAKFNHG